MEKLDAKTQPVGTLLSQQYFFRIPEYQRPFSWDADNFDDLVEDVRTAARSQEYFLGTIVLHKREAGVHDVVDGQQRLTSLMILLACLRDLVDKQEFKDGIQLKLLQKSNVVDGIPEKVRLEVKDRQFFTDLVLTPGGTSTEFSSSTLNDPDWRYLKAIEVFRSRLTKLDQTDLEEIVTFISQKCVIIVLSTSDFDDAFRLFTIVNDRGKQLRRIDILKALNIAPDAIATETARNRVAQEWETIEKQLGAPVFENVFFLLRLILLKDKPQADLLKEFQDRVFAKGIVRKGEPFFNLVFEYSKLYEQIFMDRDFIPESSPEYTRFRGLIYIMDAEFAASEWRACLLLFAKKFGPTSFYKACLLIEKIYLGQWIKGKRKDERFAEYARILISIENSKKAEDVFPLLTIDLSEIKQAALGSNIYSAGFGKYLLLRLELVTAEHDTARDFDAKSIEHVLPQKPNAQGDWASTHDLSRLDEYVNSLGNLVLLSKSKNSAAGNMNFMDKKAKYLEKRVSDYPRSIQVLTFTTWTRDVIDARTKEAAESVLLDP